MLIPNESPTDSAETTFPAIVSGFLIPLASAMVPLEPVTAEPVPICLLRMIVPELSAFTTADSSLTSMTPVEAFVLVPVSSPERSIVPLLLTFPETSTPLGTMSVAPSLTVMGTFMVVALTFAVPLFTIIEPPEMVTSPPITTDPLEMVAPGDPTIEVNLTLLLSAAVTSALRVPVNPS